MGRESRVVTVLHTIFIAACVAGFMFQSYDILSLYLRYMTASVVGIKSDQTLIPPDISICIRYVDILSQGGLTPEEKKLRDKRQRIREIEANMTIKQVFDWTPSAEQIMSGCIHKIPNNYVTHVHRNTSICMGIFEHSRFYTQEYMCYRFRLLVKKVSGSGGTFNYDNIATSLQYPGLFYGFLLNNKTLAEANILRISVHERERLPFDDIAYSQYFYRQVNNTVVYNEISVFYRKTTIEYLPAPYQTECLKYEPFMGSQKCCIDRCLKKRTLARFNKVPFTAIETEKEDVPPISAFEIENKTFSKELDSMENGCERGCGGKQCTREMFATNVLKEGTGEFRYLVIRVYVPMEPSIILNSVPKSDLQDVIVYISSSLSVWLGFSVFALNPVAMYLSVTHDRAVERGDECHCNHCTKEMRALILECKRLRRHQKKLYVGYEYDGGSKPSF